MKWASNKAIYADRKSMRQLYYATFSAKRYAKRFSRSIKTQYAAQRAHLKRQRADAQKLGFELFASPTTWAERTGKHRRTYNREWLEVERQHVEREQQNKLREAANREAIRLEVAGELLTKLLEQ